MNNSDLSGGAIFGLFALFIVIIGGIILVRVILYVVLKKGIDVAANTIASTVKAANKKKEIERPLPNVRQVFCRQCGTENLSSARFCKNCGTEIHAV